MNVTLNAPQAPHMPADPSEGRTKSVRIADSAATKLQTIAALKAEMGEPDFSTVKFLNKLVVPAIDKLHRETLLAYTEHGKSKK